MVIGEIYELLFNQSNARERHIKKEDRKKTRK